jgi:hypothetical protein
MPSYSGLWNGVYGVNYSALASNGNTFEQNNRLRNTLTKLLSRDRGTRKLMSIMRALNGVAAGGTATAQFKTVASDVQRGQPLVNGGKRTIDTKNDVNRVTTSADQALINVIFDKTFAPTSYPVDRSRNGGGNKRNGF